MTFETKVKFGMFEITLFTDDNKKQMSRYTITVTHFASNTGVKVLTGTLVPNTVEQSLAEVKRRFIEWVFGELSVAPNYDELLVAYDYFLEHGKKEAQKSWMNKPNE